KPSSTNRVSSRTPPAWAPTTSDRPSASASAARKPSPPESVVTGRGRPVSSSNTSIARPCALRLSPRSSRRRSQWRPRLMARRRGREALPAADGRHRPRPAGVVAEYLEREALRAALVPAPLAPAQPVATAAHGAQAHARLHQHVIEQGGEHVALEGEPAFIASSGHVREPADEREFLLEPGDRAGSLLETGGEASVVLEPKLDPGPS